MGGQTYYNSQSLYTWDGTVRCVLPKFSPWTSASSFFRVLALLETSLASTRLQHLYCLSYLLREEIPSDLPLWFIFW